MARFLICCGHEGDVIHLCCMLMMVPYGGARWSVAFWSGLEAAAKRKYTVAYFSPTRCWGCCLTEVHGGLLLFNKVLSFLTEVHGGLMLSDQVWGCCHSPPSVFSNPFVNSSSRSTSLISTTLHFSLFRHLPSSFILYPYFFCFIPPKAPSTPPPTSSFLLQLPSLALPLL